MHKNSIRLFIMRESFIVVKNTAKIYVMDPYVEYHSIYFPKSDIHIPLFIRGVF